MRTYALFGTYNFGIFEMYGVSVRTNGVESVRTFCGGEAIFRDFLRTYFMEGSLQYDLVRGRP